MSFHYNIDEMPKELSSCLYQLVYGKIDLIILQLKLQTLLMMLSEDLVYMHYAENDRYDNC